jgi:starch synthase
MIAMRYGCIPIVSAVGGLKDSVIDGVTGLTFSPTTAARLARAIRRGIDLMADTHAWEQLRRNAMSQDFSWAASARKYLQHYERLVAQPAPTKAD